MDILALLRRIGTRLGGVVSRSAALLWTAGSR
jgi:hypothetical protein